MNSALWLRSGRLVLLVLLFTVAGCGPEMAKVKGRVKFVDKNLTAGTVGFMGKGGQIAVSQITSDGSYELTAPVGDVKITVQVPAVLPGTGPKPPPGVPDTRPTGSAAKPVVKIPAKYLSPESSGLTYTVLKGEQTYDITLKP